MINNYKNTFLLIAYKSFLKMNEAILGIDIGTSSIKCVLFDFEGQEIVSASNSYDLLRTEPDNIEIDSGVLWGSVVGAIHKINRLQTVKM